MKRSKKLICYAAKKVRPKNASSPPGNAPHFWFWASAQVSVSLIVGRRDHRILGGWGRPDVFGSGYFLAFGVRVLGLRFACAVHAQVSICSGFYGLSVLCHSSLFRGFFKFNYQVDEALSSGHFQVYL
jgi:hypothetical protein